MTAAAATQCRRHSRESRVAAGRRTDSEPLTAFDGDGGPAAAAEARTQAAAMCRPRAPPDPPSRSHVGLSQPTPTDTPAYREPGSENFSSGGGSEDHDSATVTRDVH